MYEKHSNIAPASLLERTSGLLSLVLLLSSTVAIRGATIAVDSPSYANVSAAVTQAHDGDTINVPPGSATWSSTLVISKAITLQGAGKTQTIITNSSTVNGGGTTPVITLTDGGNNSLPRRVTGFGFKGAVVTDNFYARGGKGISCLGPLSNKRVDNCRFDGLYTSIWIGNSIGVSDHNEYYHNSYVWRHVDGQNQQYMWDHFRPPGAVGGDMAHNSLNYFFHENEYAELTGESSVAVEDYCTSYVVRYCNFVLREANGIYSAAQCFNLLETHGDNPSVSEYSVLAILIYENDIQMKNGSAMTFFQQRGGTGLFFNNRVVTSGSVSGTASVELREENGIPGEDGAAWPPWGDPQYNDKVHRTYIYNNTYNGAVQAPHIRNLSQTVLSIGTSPASCPTCSAWTTPESPLLLPPYPHPLVSGSGPTPTPTPVPTVTPTPSPLPGLSFNSNAGDIAVPFTINADTSISQSVETSDPTLGGKATYTFAVTDAGDYTMLSLVSCPDSGSNSFFVDIDGDPISTMVWQVDVTSGFESRTVTWSGVTTPRFWALNAGVHQLVIRGREAGAKIKSITLVKRPGTPSSPQVVPGSGN